MKFLQTLWATLPFALAVRAATTSTSSASAVTTSTSTVSTGPLSSLTTVSTSASTLSTSTRSSSSSSASASASGGPTLLSGATVQSTILVLASDAYSGSVATSGFNGYGIPYQLVLVPKAGITLPTLNSSTTGYFGGIVIASQVAYDYGTNGASNWQSALTDDQWNALYAYQIVYGVRMVQYDVYPGPLFGTTALGGCCGTGVEQLFAFTNTAAFPQAGIKQGAGVSTQGLYHYVASITDTNTTTEIAQFAANANYASPGTAAVINNFNGRQQMVFFTSFATDWSATSNFLTHAYITWMTRGLYAGYRRVTINTQIDDVFLSTPIYGQNGWEYRTTTQDLDTIAAWVPKIQAKMNTGSYYRPEMGHNGNGCLIYASNTKVGQDACGDGPVYLDDFLETTLEFQKPLGTGVTVWPDTPTSYDWTSTCINQDPMKVWFQNTANRDKFMHLTHTFTHYELNNATYGDALKEIQVNQVFLQNTGISKGNFTANGLIPPAITGLHNGDAMRAWHDAGLSNAVGDNTRPVLRNTQNQMWALTTDTAGNGYAGYQVLPRWATRIYYNCESANCTLTEWINTSAGSGTFTDLLNTEKADTMRHFFGLYHDAYMFHQANLRTQGLAPIMVNGQSQSFSIFQAWVETVVAEFTRLVNWPLQTLKQADQAIAYANRQTRDNCNYSMSWNSVNSKITGVTVSSANGNACSAPIPLTVPGTVTNTNGMVLEKIGNDPLTIWVKLTGAAQTFTLSTPIPF